MSPVVHIVMFGWIPVVIYLFSRLKPRTAVITAFIMAWLFLPNVSYPLPGFPDYTKMSATCWGIFIAAAMFDMESLSRFRFRFIDLPMVIWCLCPIASSLTNDYGLYDGLAVGLTQTVTWGFPYFIGRVYFSSLEGLKELAIGIFIGGMVYVPLCLFESRMSPQLHNLVYGFQQHTFIQTYRWGGWRPMVFLSHGLMLGVWMMSASVMGVWLWFSGVLRSWKGLSMAWMVPLLLFTTVWCRSTGAVALLLIALIALFLSRTMKTPILLILIIAVPVFYLSTRGSGVWSGENLISFIEQHISAERAESLRFRMYNENILVEQAMKKPLYGWATWGQARVYDEEGKDLSVTDGLWIIAFGNHGLTGLISMTLSLLVPVMLLTWRYPATRWSDPKVAPAAASSILLCVYMVDNLFNAMTNPVFILIAGGISGLVTVKAALEDELPVLKKMVTPDGTSVPRYI